MNIISLDEQMARQICTWKYEAPYDVYNMPSWEYCVQKGYGITKQEVRQKDMYAILICGKMIGYFRLTEKADGIYFGIGLSPENCYKGYGKTAISLAIEKYKEIDTQKPLTLIVRTFNERAMKCYKSCGFEIVDKRFMKTPSGEGDFYFMRYNGL